MDKQLVFLVVAIFCLIGAGVAHRHNCDRLFNGLLVACVLFLCLPIVTSATEHFREQSDGDASVTAVTPVIEAADEGERVPVLGGTLTENGYQAVLASETGSFTVPFKQNITVLPAGVDSYAVVQFKSEASDSGVREWSGAHLYTSDLTEQQVKELQSK